MLMHNNKKYEKGLFLQTRVIFNKSKGIKNCRKETNAIFPKLSHHKIEDAGTTFKTLLGIFEGETNVYIAGK